MNADPIRAKAIFLEAVEKPAAEWPALLDQACTDQPELRRAVEQLLEAHREVGTLPHQTGGDPPGPADDNPATERPGTVIGPYKLLQRIGEGGMGTVFMAEQTQPVQRKVALKVIKAGMDTRQVIARFEAERQALAMMDHVNIARVFDGGTTEHGRPYFVMELVHGVAITKYCDDNHLTPRERLELFVPVCQAIQHAHQKGIIHRDVKPSNVMITLYDGKPVPKVIDFGVAKATEQKLTERTLFTQYGTMLGTLEYMSPEQAEMSALGVDTRSDIYSLGVLLYELLTGSTPLTHKRFQEEAYAEILRLIKEEEPPRPSTRLSDSGEALASISAQRHTEPTKLAKLMRGELDWIVMRTLEKDRNRRYETASAFAADVQRYLNDEQVQACPPSAAYRFRKFARKNRKLLATATAFATLLVLTTIGAALAAVQSGRLAEKEQELRSTAEQRADAESKAREELDRRLYANRIALAQQELYAQNTGRAQELLAECPAPLRGWEWYYLKRFQPGNPLTLGGNYNSSAAFSPNGRYLALRSNGKNVDIIDPATGRINRTLVGITSWIDCYGLAFCPKTAETILAAGDANGKAVRLWNADTGREIQSLGVDALRLRTVAFSPDGHRLAAGSINRGAKVWDWRNGRVLFELPQSISRFAFSPDGRRLAVAVFGEERAVILVEADTGREIRSFGNHDGGTEGLAYSPNTRRIATSGADGTVKIWDEETGELLRTLRGHVDSVKDVVYTPDGRRLASAGWDKTVKIWDAESGQETLTLRGHADVVMKLEFSPDGRLLASAGLESVKVWNTTSANEISDSEALKVPGHVGSVQSVAFSPDGRLLASAASDRLIKVWDVASPGKGVEPKGLTLQADTGLGLSVAFSPDSRRLASAGWAGSLKVWDARSAKSLLTLPLKMGQEGSDIRSIVYSSDGRRLASAGPGALTVRDATTGETLAVSHIPSGNLNCVAFSPDGRNLALASLRVVSIRDGATAQELRMIPHSAMVWGVAYSPDGRQLASACFDRLIKIWDTSRWKEIRTLRGHNDRAMSVAYSPDGKRLASGSGDSTVKVWDVASGQELATFRGHTGYVWSVAFSPDGRLLTSAGGHHGSGEVKVWDLTRILDAADRPEEIEKARRQAIEFYAMLAVAQPKVWEHRRNLGDAYTRHDQWDKAIDEYTKAIDLNPDAWVELADSFKERGRHAEIVKLLERLVAAHPKSALYRQAMGELYKTLGQWDQAAAAYSKAIELTPDAWEAWSGRAFVHFSRQQWDGAVADFTKAIELAPEVHTNWWHRGHSYLQLAQWDKAAANFGKVVEQWPDGAEGWYLRGVAFAQLNQPDKALADLREAVAKGSYRAEQLKSDPRLAPLRTHKDFGKLLDELERKEKSRSKQDGR